MKGNILKKYILLLSLLFSVATAGEPIDYTQHQMMVPPTQSKHLGTKEYIDGQDEAISQTAADGLAAEATVRAEADTALGIRIDGIEEGYVKYDEDGNISWPAGLALRVEMPDGEKHNVLRTDTNGNILLGEDDRQVNIDAVQRPTVTIGVGGTSDGIALMSDFTGYATEIYVDAADALKADLVGGKVPLSQLPPEVQTNFWSVPTSADLVTLTSATQGDIAVITTGDEAGWEYVLSASDPTVLANWIHLAGGGGGGGGSPGVVSWAGKDGVVVPVMSDISDSASVLGDYALQSSLANYAPINSPALTGTPTSPTPPANASGQEIMTAAGLRTALTGNLGATDPLMDGTASAGAVTTVARSDHRHPSDTSRIAVADLSTADPLVNGTATAGTSTKVSREDHVHPISISTPDYRNREVLYYNPEGVSLGYLPVVIPSNGSGTGNSFVVTKDGYISCYLGIDQVPTSPAIRIELLINEAIVSAQYLNFTRTNSNIRHNFGIFSVASGDSIALRISSNYNSSLNLVYTTGSTSYGLFFFNKR